MVSVPLPGAPAVFHGVSCGWLTLRVLLPVWLQLAGLPLQWPFVVGLAVSWYTTWFSTLCQRSFSLRCVPLAGSVPFWLQFAGLLLRWSLVVGLEVSLVRRLVLYLVPCSSSGACGLRSLPCSGFPWGFLTFLSPGACPSAPLVASVGQQPFPSFIFASPAPAGLRGFTGFCTLCLSTPVEVVSALWVPVSSPCLLSLPLGWVYFWHAVATASVSCEVAV